MINRALVNSPAHLFTAIEESEKMKDIEPMWFYLNINKKIESSLKITI